jgi:hypothetical protein
VENQWLLEFGAPVALAEKVTMTKDKRKETRQDMFTTTISLCPEVHQKLKHLAVDLKVPFRDLIRAAIEGYLARGKEKEGE